MGLDLKGWLQLRSLGLGGYFSQVLEVVHFAIFIYLLNGGKLTLL
jgi:hypothetical protein